MTNWNALLSVAGGAAAGGVLRYLVGTWFAQRFGPGFPFGTLFINISGSFLIGVVIELSQTRALGMTPLVRLMLATGLLGGYTTFSSFAYETATIASEGAPLLSAAYAAGSVILGIVAYVAGTVSARLMLRA